MAKPGAALKNLFVFKYLKEKEKYNESTRQVHVKENIVQK